MLDLPKYQSQSSSSIPLFKLTLNKDKSIILFATQEAKDKESTLGQAYWAVIRSLEDSGYPVQHIPLRGPDLQHPCKCGDHQDTVCARILAYVKHQSPVSSSITDGVIKVEKDDKRISLEDYLNK